MKQTKDIQNFGSKLETAVYMKRQEDNRPRIMRLLNPKTSPYFQIQISKWYLKFRFEQNLQVDFTVQLGSHIQQQGQQ